MWSYVTHPHICPCTLCKIESLLWAACAGWGVSIDCVAPGFKELWGLCPKASMNRTHGLCKRWQQLGLDSCAREMSVAVLIPWKTQTKIAGDTWVNGLFPCSGQAQKRRRHSSKPQELTLHWKAPWTSSLAVDFEERKVASDAIQSQAPWPPHPPSTRYQFHSSWLSIKINSLAFHSLVSIYLAWEDTGRFVAVPESPCSTFLISEQSNQTR